MHISLTCFQVTHSLGKVAKAVASPTRTMKALIFFHIDSHKFFRREGNCSYCSVASCPIFIALLAFALGSVSDNSGMCRDTMSVLKVSTGFYVSAMCSMGYNFRKLHRGHMSV